jgi:hypothetical protein
MSLKSDKVLLPLLKAGLGKQNRRWIPETHATGEELYALSSLSDHSTKGYACNNVICLQIQAGETDKAGGCPEQFQKFQRSETRCHNRVPQPGALQ